MAKRSVISQLASAGEEALGKLAQNPVTHKAVEGALGLKERVEKLVSSLADMDGRVSRIEKRVAALEKAAKSPATTRARSTASKTRSTAARTRSTRSKSS